MRRQTANGGTAGGVVSRAEAELRRHLRDLGLADADAYRAWCRENGFSAGLQKSWQERRNENEAAEKQRAAANAEAEQTRHRAVLGFYDETGYAAWCRENRFGNAPHKTREQRRREAETRERERAASALAGAKRLARRPDEVLKGIAAGAVNPAELKSPTLNWLNEVFTAVGRGRGDVRAALLRLLLHVQPRADGLLGVEPVIALLGPQPGNTFPDALYALACSHRFWLRPVEEWRPDTHNAPRQFSALARHLLARYDVPAFMDIAWFRGDDKTARRQQDWFRHVGTGANIRTAPGLTVHLTKMAAHHFLQAPPGFSIEQAVRWGQVRALGGDEHLVRALIGTRLGDTLGNADTEAFWATVIHFFVNNPLLDTLYVGPIVDFVHHRKYVGDEAAPADPNFSMKGRTAAALRRLVDDWHHDLAREEKRTVLDWAASGIGEGTAPFRYVQCEREAGRAPVWTVHEIVDGRELTEEGREMRHCVASYAHSCARGHVSIWSLQVREGDYNTPRRVLTIAVDNARRAVTQVRGRCNKQPGAAGRHSSARLQDAPDVLRRWAASAGLSVPSHV